MGRRVPPPDGALLASEALNNITGGVLRDRIGTGIEGPSSRFRRAEGAKGSDGPLGTIPEAGGFRAARRGMQLGDDALRYILSRAPRALGPLIAVLEKVRTHFGQPVTVNSGSRCLPHNTSVGGSPTPATIALVRSDRTTPIVLNPGTTTTVSLPLPPASEGTTAEVVVVTESGTVLTREVPVDCLLPAEPIIDVVIDCAARTLAVVVANASNTEASVVVEGRTYGFELPARGGAHVLRIPERVERGNGGRGSWNFGGEGTTAGDSWGDSGRRLTPDVLINKNQAQPAAATVALSTETPGPMVLDTVMPCM